METTKSASVSVFQWKRNRVPHPPLRHQFKTEDRAEVQQEPELQTGPVVAGLAGLQQARRERDAEKIK